MIAAKMPNPLGVDNGEDKAIVPGRRGDDGRALGGLRRAGRRRRLVEPLATDGKPVVLAGLAERATDG